MVLAHPTARGSGEDYCAPRCRDVDRRSGWQGAAPAALCDPATDLTRIAEVIRHQGNSPDPLYPDSLRAEHMDLKLRGSLRDALEDVKARLGCVVIVAHASSSKGIFKVITVPQVAELVRDGLIDAVDQCESTIEKLRGAGQFTNVQLNSLARTVSSDPHNLDEIAQGPCRTGAEVSLDQAQQGGCRRAEAGSPRSTNPSAHPAAGASERRSLVGHALGSGGRVRVVIERPGSAPVPDQRRPLLRTLRDTMP